MSSTILLSELETAVQNQLRNTVGTPLTTDKRISAYNLVIDALQAETHWNPTKRIKEFDYLQGEADYSIENDLGITDFKAVWDIRFPDTDQKIRNIEEFQDIGEKMFSQFRGKNSFINRLTVEERDDDNILRLLTTLGNGRTIVHEFDFLTSNGTWTSDETNSDATTLVLDTARKAVGSGSLKFDIDVSQSSNNRSTIYTSVALASIDGTNLLNVGHFRGWLGLHNVSAANLALITSITLHWGSDVSGTTPATKANYWSVSPTTTVNNGTFKAGFNKIDWNWGDATKTGSPDVSDLKYFEIQINYSSGLTDSINIRIDQLVMLEPETLELVYFSDAMVLNGTTRQIHFSTDTVDTSEQLLLPKRFTYTFVKLALKELFPQKESDNQDYIRVTQEANAALEDMVNAIGNEIVREQQTLRLTGNATGRVETRMW